MEYFKTPFLKKKIIFALSYNPTYSCEKEWERVSGSKIKFPSQTCIALHCAESPDSFRYFAAFLKSTNNSNNKL